jgi:virginiamycin B lyase
MKVHLRYTHRKELVTHLQLHATDTFFMVNATNGRITAYATSRASPLIYGVNDTNSVPEEAYTLPYWIEKGSDGSIWFNEHEGNKIARFEPSNGTLYEYWIPTQDRQWGNSYLLIVEHVA